MDGRNWATTLTETGSILLCGIAIAASAFLILRSERKKAAVGRRYAHLQIYPMTSANALWKGKCNCSCLDISSYQSVRYSQLAAFHSMEACEGYVIQSTICVIGLTILSRHSAPCILPQSSQHYGYYCWMALLAINYWMMEHQCRLAWSSLHRSFYSSVLAT